MALSKNILLYENCQLRGTEINSQRNLLRPKAALL